MVLTFNHTIANNVLQKMNMIYRTLLILPIAFFITLSAQAQSGIGTVRGTEILSEMPEYKEMEAKVAQVRQLYQDTLQLFQQNLDAEVQNFQNQQGVYSPEKRAAEEERINQFYKNGLEYQNIHLGPNGTVAQYAAQLLQPLREKILTAVKAVAKQKKLAVVLNEEETLYADQTIDITLDVQLYMRNAK